MGKSLLFRLPGIGAIAKELRPVFDAEQIIVADEGIRGRLICRHVKGPGNRSTHCTAGFSGCLGVTKKRIVCFTYRKRQIQIPVDAPNISEFFVDMPEKDLLCVAFESSAFGGGWQGILEFRFKTAKARDFRNVMMSLGVRQATLGAGQGTCSQR